jgi:hypothetical protein
MAHSDDLRSSPQVLADAMKALSRNPGAFISPEGTCLASSVHPASS